jgi:hypothetical protein
MIEFMGILLLSHLAVSKAEIGTQEIMEKFKAIHQEIGYQNLMRLLALFSKNGWVAKRVVKGIPPILKIKITDPGLQFITDLYAKLDMLTRTFGELVHTNKGQGSKSKKARQSDEWEGVDSIVEMLITDVLGMDLEAVDAPKRERLRNISERIIKIANQSL